MFLINDVPVSCIIQAAQMYHIPPVLVISVLKTENGRVGMARRNSNGTYDYGPMQINTFWVNKVMRYGYTAEDLQYNACDNVAVGTWILAQEIANSNNISNGIGDYHSHNLQKNYFYSWKVIKTYRLINAELAASHS